LFFFLLIKVLLILLLSWTSDGWENSLHLDESWSKTMTRNLYMLL